jgi:membrane protein DedA with SNARE-associated domain
MEWISHLFEQYGYFVLLAGLFAESMALPFPGELAMAISGHMSSLGNMNILIVLLCSYLGAVGGTMVTYYLGYRLGTPFFTKYGKYVLLNEERISAITKWFDRFGNKLLLVSYFIPGLRHFTGYMSGILRVRLGVFIVYNFTGGLAWVLTYVMIGKLFGNKIEQLLHLVSHYSMAAIIVLSIGAAAVFLIKRNKQAIMEWVRTKTGRNERVDLETEAP